MQHHRVIQKCPDSFAKKCWDSTLLHVQANNLLSWPTPLKPLKSYTAREHNWRRKEHFGWLVFYLHTHHNSEKQFFIYQGWFLHGSGNCCSSIYSSGTESPGLLWLLFQICPKNSFLLKKHVRISLHITMHGAWLKGQFIVAVVSINIPPWYFTSGILTKKEELWVNTIFKG